MQLTIFRADVNVFGLDGKGRVANKRAGLDIRRRAVTEAAETGRAQLHGLAQFSNRRLGLNVQRANHPS